MIVKVAKLKLHFCFVAVCRCLK